MVIEAELQELMEKYMAIISPYVDEVAIWADEQRKLQQRDITDEEINEKRKEIFRKNNIKEWDEWKIQQRQ
ncbi:MAG: hypothetical protein GX640_17235 [Fibrobacter sp.]|nr:hypothetical protein [Fibrobacter sp.]